MVAAAEEEIGVAVETGARASRKMLTPTAA